MKQSARLDDHLRNPAGSDTEETIASIALEVAAPSLQHALPEGDRPLAPAVA